MFFVLDLVDDEDDDDVQAVPAIQKHEQRTLVSMLKNFVSLSLTLQLIN
jgi:hypothetical protein